MNIFSFFRPAVAKATPPKPINWEAPFHKENEWIGRVGDYWDGFELFKITREEFVETGVTYCLSSQLNKDCLCCYPTLELAQERADEQLQRLLKIAA